MPSFSDSFWTPDYAAGLGVLFSKLQQGVIENRQFLTIARMRAEAEDVYGQRLSDIAPTVDKVQGGFGRDDGATVRKAYEGVRTEMDDASKTHRKIAQNIRDLVVNPFSRWCDAHETRIQDSQDELQARVKAHEKQAEAVKKLRSVYFTKCLLVEDLEEENKLAFQDPETSPKAAQTIPEIKVEPHQEPEEEEDEPYEIGDEIYTPDQIKKILEHMLNNIKMGETKVPILGTYLNTSSGSDIVEYLQKNMKSSSVSYAERIGQDLVSHGLLRLVGAVGSTFANSSKMFYQWRPRAFKLAGVPERKASLARTFSMPTSGDAGDSAAGTINEYLAGWNVLNTSRPNETPAERMRREAREADDRYKRGVHKLDEMRCELEEAILLHLRFLERCELDRLKAIKTVVLDFSGTISNVIPSLQSAVDHMMLFQETVQPQSDLRYLLENYRTGGFAPKVVVYENYYNKVDEQTFGVDLEARARADKKRVPAIVTTLLTYLDHHYPDLEGDEARRGVWLTEVPLGQIHQLRDKINNGKPVGMAVFSEFDIPTVASLLKLYLLEIPDSLVSSHVYEIIRTIYNTPTPENNDEARIPILQQTLSQLRLTNIATLDACMNHFTRLIDLTSADEEYVVKLVTILGPCILRPRTQTSLTMEDKHPYRLIRDLLAHKDPIFSELKRMSTMGPGASPAPGLAPSNSLGRNAPRPRAISTDESNRKAHMEERNRLILEKASGGRGRAASPAPGPRGLGGGSHRRDRSVGGPETRFPISTPGGMTSPTTPRHVKRQSVGPNLPYKRSSLEVPGQGSPGSVSASTNGSANGSPSVDAVSAAAAMAGLGLTDGLEMVSNPAVFKLESESKIEKRNSLGRSGARFSSGRRVGPGGSVGGGGATTNTGSPKTGTRPSSGVTLTDGPVMND